MAGWIITQLKKINFSSSEQTKYVSSKMGLLKQINLRNQNPMSQKTFNQLVHMYGVTRFAQAVNASSHHSNIQNRSGWVIAYLRSEAKRSRWKVYI